MLHGTCLPAWLSGGQYGDEDSISQGSQVSSRWNMCVAQKRKQLAGFQVQDRRRAWRQVPVGNQQPAHKDHKKRPGVSLRNPGHGKARASEMTGCRLSKNLTILV